METRDDTAHFQATTEVVLSVPHLMCWRTEGTFTIARCCCGVLLILAPDRKLQTYLLTYNLHILSTVMTQRLSLFEYMVNMDRKVVANENLESSPVLEYWRRLHG